MRVRIEGSRVTQPSGFLRNRQKLIVCLNYILFENMQPKLVEDAPRQTLRTLHHKGTVHAQFTPTPRRRQLGGRSL